ncbi:MAG: D-alanyl-D-alanine carboxypeptidase family protein [Bianqueaceae bacterium]
MDADSGQVLYDRTVQTLFSRQHNKIACMLALEHCSDETVVPSSSISSPALPRLRREGDDGTMSACSHDGIGKHWRRGGPECRGLLDAFVDMMNARAEEIGATDTHFVNAHGLHSDDHYTTAYDLALISKEAWKLPYFQELIGEMFYEIPPTNLCNESRYFYRKHKLTRQGTSLYYEYCLGGKTGYTTEADNTLVSFARKDGLTLIAVSLCCPTTQQYLNTKNLFEYGYSHYRSVEYSTVHWLNGFLSITIALVQKRLDMPILSRMTDSNTPYPMIRPTTPCLLSISPCLCRTISSRQAMWTNLSAASPIT